MRNSRLKKGESLRERYGFYDTVKQLRTTPIREYIWLKSGHVRISVGDETQELYSGEGASFFTNIPHEIIALEDADIRRLIPKPGLARYSFST